MPIVRIEDRIQRDSRTKTAVVECIFRCLKIIFGVIQDELQARYTVFAGEDFVTPGGKNSYLHIEITVFTGRKLETKKRLYAMLTEELAKVLCIVPEDILVLLNEVPAENWGMRGGKAACDLSFGYEIAV